MEPAAVPGDDEAALTTAPMAGRRVAGVQAQDDGRRRLYGEGQGIDGGRSRASTGSWPVPRRR